MKNNKTFEIRSSNTSKRERIAIAYSRTGMIFGEVTVINSKPLTKRLFEENIDKHQLQGWTYEQLINRYPHPYVWELSNPTVYEEPVPYTHKKGAVIWVKNAI